MIWAAIFIVILCFAGVLLFGAPYLPTLKTQQQEALKLLDLKPGQTLLELGCGDGRVLLAAAKKGIYGVGYELNPMLYIVAKVLTWHQRSLVKIHFGNFWVKKWPQANGIYVFLLQKYMQKLDKKIIQENCKNIKLVSYAFTVPGKRPLKEKKGMFLYTY